MGRDLGQWAHDEQPFGGAGMGKNQPRFVLAGSAMGDQIEVQGAVRIGVAASTAKGALERFEPAQELAWRRVRARQRNAIEVLRT